MNFNSNIRNMVTLLLGFLIFSSAHASTQERLPTPVSSNEACKNKICFAETVQVGDRQLTLQGISKFTYMVFNLYTAALYTEEAVTTSEEALSDRAKLLVIHYHRKIKSKDFIRSADAILRKNPNVNVSEIDSEIVTINSWYNNVRKNDRYQLLYTPENGTDLLFNDELVGTIEGATFAKYYLGIWLSEYSLGKKFTRRLLNSQTG